MSGGFASALLNSARRLGSATLHEAAGKTGALPASIRPVDVSWRLAGPACTVRNPTGDNLALHRAIVTARPGDVLVIATGDEQPDWGYWGEVMSTAARVAGLEGIVLQGGSRDHAILPEVGFPVFSLGACIQGTGKQPVPHSRETYADVEIGSASIRPGDLIVGDVDGVVAIPAAYARRTVESGLERHAAEADMLRQLRAGQTTLELLGLN